MIFISIIDAITFSLNDAGVLYCISGCIKIAQSLVGDVVVEKSEDDEDDDNDDEDEEDDGEEEDGEEVQRPGHAVVQTVERRPLVREQTLHTYIHKL